MHRSDRLGLGIIVSGALLIGGTYLLFRLFGDSASIAFIGFVGLVVLLGLIAKYFTQYKDSD